MTDVPSNLIPTRITQLPEYEGDSTEGYTPYAVEGRTYKAKLANIVAPLADDVAIAAAAAEAARDAALAYKFQTEALVQDGADSALLSQAWAEGTEPGGPNTDSSKGWSYQSQGFALSLETDAAGGFYDSLAAGVADPAVAVGDAFNIIEDGRHYVGQKTGPATGEIIAEYATTGFAEAISGPGGAGEVGSLAPVAGATLRTVSDRLELISIRDAGAVENSGNAAPVDTLFSNVTPGQAVYANRLNAAAGGCAFSRTDSSFSITRGFDLHLQNGVDLRVDQTAGERDAVISFNPTLGLNETTPSTSGEWRGGWFSGGRVFTNALTGSQTDSGGYAFEAGTGSSKTITGLTLEKMTLGGGDGAVHFNSSFNRTAAGSEIQWCQLVRCTLNGNTRFAGEDGLVSVDCIAFSPRTDKPAYTFNMTFGAFNSGVFGGTIVGVGGSALVQNGSLVKFHNVQMEHAPGMGPSTPATGLPGGAQMFITGFTYKSQGGEILGCNFGAGSFITNTVYFANATGWIVDRCQFNVANAGASADLLLTSQAATAADDTDNLTVGYNMNWRGARPIRAVGSMTDVSRRMIIDQTGASLRKQHRGIWFPMFPLLTATASGLTDVSFEAMIEHSGMVTLQGNVTRAGFFGSGVAVCTFPSWMLPHRDVVIPVHSVTGARAVGNLSATTGVFTIQDGGMAAVTDLWFPAAAWKAIVNPDYVTVA